VVLRIIAALSVGRLVVNLGRDGLVAEGFGRTYAAIQIAWACLVGLGVYVGASVGGLSGAATAQVIVASIVVAMTLAVLHRKLDVHATFLRFVVRPALGALVGGLAAWLVSTALDSLGVPFVQLVAGGTVGALLCFIVGFDRRRRRMLLEPVRRRWVQRRGSTDEHETTGEPASTHGAGAER
jgi:uncharacterized protein YacL